MKARHWSLKRYRLLAVLVALLAGIAAIGHAWQFINSQAVLRESTLAGADRRAQQLADAISDQTEVLFREVDFALLALRDAWLAGQSDFESTERSLRTTLPSEALANITVIGPDGYVRYSAGSRQTGIDLGDREHFLVHAQGTADRLYISKPLEARIIPGWTIFISRAIRRDGVFDGVIVVGLSTDFLSDWIDTVDLVSGDLIALMRSDGALLARTLDNEMAMGKSVQPDRPFLRPNAPAGGVFHAPGSIDAVPRIYGWHRLGLNGLIVAVGLDQSLITTPIDRHYQQELVRTLFFALIVLLLGFGIGVLLARFGRQQDSLRTHVERLRESQRIAKLGNWELIHADDSLRWSEETYRIFEIAPEHFGATYQAFLDAVHPDDRNRIDDDFARSVQSREPYETVHRLPMPDGRVKYVQERGVTLYAPDGHALRSVGTVQDISALKQAEEVLQRYELLAAHTHDIILFMHRDDGRLLDANAAAIAAYGYRREELLQLRIHDLRAEDTRPLIESQMLKADTQGILFETIHRRHDGSTFPVEVSSQGALIGSTPTLISVIRDITRRNQVQAELETYRLHLEQLVAERTAELSLAKEEAETANIAKSEFLANMSHEIRTPLNAISGMAYLIRRGGLSEQQSEQLNKLVTASEQLLNTINAILDIAKIEAGKFALEQLRIHPEQIADQVLAMIHERSRSKGLRLSAEIDPLPDALLGDPTRLQQALLNYASNAVKFTESGHVRLRIRCLTEDREGVMLRFEVEDSGIGIPEEVLPRLFHAFEQADNSRTRQYGGTGLGLVITRKIAESMGGEAGVESTPGVGSTFWFSAWLRRDSTPDFRSS